MNAECIVALDVPNSAAVPPLLEMLGDRISYYKLGLELFCAEGPSALTPLKEQHKKIFLDLKLHDIPRTVERAVMSAAEHGVDLLTVHACGGRAMLEAAAQAAQKCGAQAPKLIAVTTLTSLNLDDFVDLGIQRSITDQALALGKLAIEAGIDGLVTSVLEVAKLRATFGPDTLLVTPGIRLPEDDVGDQKRVATPALAVQSGASHLVVGRTILGAANPAAAADAVRASMAEQA